MPGRARDGPARPVSPMARRLLLALLGLLAGWLTLELYFGWRGPGSGAGPGVGPGGGADPRSIFEPNDDQRQRWQRHLDRLTGGSPPRGQTVNRFSARYGWSNVPGSRGRHQGLEVSFDERGARGHGGTAPPLAADALRVTCYGDSFTFGTEVEDRATWPARLAVHGDGRYEVLNLGVGGWGTDQALLRFRDERDALAADVVLMGLLSENIGRNVNRLRVLYSPRTATPLVKPRFILADGELELVPQPYPTEVALYRAALDGSLGVDMAPHEHWRPAEDSWSNVVDALRGARQSRKGAWWKLWWDPEGDAYRVTRALLEAFHREGLEGGARFAGVLLFPSRQDIGDPERRLEALAADLRARDIPYLDLYPLIQARHDRGEAVYGEAHFTPAANDEVARAILDWLDDELGP